MPSQPVEGADRGVRGRHADVHVQRRHRRGHGVAEQGADQLVALAVGDLGVALLGRRVGSGGDQARARGEHRTAQAVQHPDRLGRVLAHVGDQLDLAGVDLDLDLAAVRQLEPVQHVIARVHEPPRVGVGQEQLLLNAERVRLALAEANRLAGCVSRSAQASEVAR